MTSPQKHRRSVYLDSDQWARLAEIAARDQRSTNGLIRVMVTEYLEAHSLSRPLRDLHRAYGGDGNIDLPGPEYIEVSTEADNGRKVYERLDRPETRDPSDEEARALREAFPHLKEPKVVDPNARKR